jgi:hypothetical protein
MEKRKQSKVAMTYGAMYGLAASIIYLIFYFAGADIQSKLPQYIGYLLLILFIVLGVKNYRDQDLEGHISYGKSLGTGVLIGLFGGIIMGFYTVLMFTVVDPGLSQKIIEAAQQQMIDKGLPEDQIEVGLTWTRKLMNPGFLFLFSIVGGAFMAFIFSLIISVFLKKEQDPFNSQVL